MRYLVTALVACAVVVSLAETQSANRRRVRLLPVDEAIRDRSLADFRADLVRKVKARDREAVVETLDPAIREDVAADLGLKPAEGESELWQALEQLLQLGGTFRKGSETVFCAPYTYSSFPKPVPDVLVAEEDPWVIIKSNVPVRGTPKADGRILARLSYDLVLLSGAGFPFNGEPLQWRGVKLPDGREGYVRVEEIRAPDDFHACFARRGGGWKVIELARTPPM